MPRMKLCAFKMAININHVIAIVLNEETATNFQNLYQLSQLFLQQIGLGQHDDCRRNQVNQVIKFARNFIPENCIEQELQAELSILSEDKRNKINLAFSRMKQGFMEE